MADALTTFAQLVEKRDFDGALNQWQGVKGQVDGFTYWYNLGTLQTLRENYPEARYALEKARFLTIYSDATEHQLRGVVQELAVDTPTSSMTLGPHLTNALVYLGPIKLWFVAVTLTLIFLFSIKKTVSKKIRLTFLTLGFLPLLLVGWFHLSSVAFVALKPIEMHEGPSRVFAGGRSLPAGARVLGWVDDDWIKIYDESAQTVWLSRSEVVLKAGWLWGNSL